MGGEASRYERADVGSVQRDKREDNVRLVARSTQHLGVRGGRGANVVHHFSVYVVRLHGLQSELEMRVSPHTHNSSVSHVVVNLQQLVSGQNHHAAHQDEQENTRDNTHLDNTTLQKKVLA